MGKAIVGALMILIAGCGPASREAGVTHPGSSLASPSASPIPSPAASISTSPSPTATARPPAAAYIAVRFTGLPAGTFPTHVHSVCSGSQNFHIAVVQSLVIRGRAGAVQVPEGYFGRGLCLIVYSSPSLSRVLTTRRI